jgi:hypothetical protein
MRLLLQQIAVSKDDELEPSIAWVYIRGPAELPPRTLSLEIYFKDSRPKLELEIYAQNFAGRHNSHQAVFRQTGVFLRLLVSESHATNGVITRAEKVFQPQKSNFNLILACSVLVSGREQLLL